ncbi:quinoprotein glucose dehydrogenase [Sediminibacillus dalangtanensis]|uniref:Quinoprotein glucose dehydrogenase n=1 Tax=Sediminibacillus dalangtanensis TaxID=2729421 RepID=A0ABX7VR99_9BACI|nr:PQQ-dependent sugar dehydrogenase [Sediminibacillus dalangtanensis]QTM98090.1 quinoprotein glucose dehydrogenase [Sediminibacillus dalangtanensis]
MEGKYEENGFDRTLFLLIASGCSDSTKPEGNQLDDNQPEGPLSGKHEVDTIASELEEPWEIVRWENTLYISERTGTIVKISLDDRDLARKPVQLDETLAEVSEAGLLGFAFPDSFSEDKEAFVYYSYSKGQNVYQRVARVEEKADRWKETGVLLDNIPGGQVHHGGRIEIGPDDKLYVTIGDATKQSAAQDLGSLSGSILRINQDGSIPKDNPDPQSPIYSWGHRNPQGLAWDDQGNLYATEHGDQAHDEINLIKPGNNYGWPQIEGDRKQQEMERPLVHSGEKTWAPSGMDYKDGVFLFASLRGEALRRFDPESNRQEVVVEGYGRIRDVLATNDGVYFITNNTDGRGTPVKQDDRLLFMADD